MIVDILKLLRIYFFRNRCW